MGNRTGDNNQLRALAAALGFAFETKQLTYNRLRHLPFVRRGLAIVARESRTLIRPPWPDLVIGVGYGSVSVARYIRDRTGGRARLVHVGNPRCSLPDFDLVITTPQYWRRARNLVELPFAIGNPAGDAEPASDELAWLRRFPRPRALVAVGGPARHWQLDHRVLASAITTIQAKFAQGSLIIATSPRTDAATRHLLEGLELGSNAAIVERYPAFGTLLATADQIFVTGDSVSMLSEAILTGKPVGMIPIRRSIRGRIVHWLWERPTGSRTMPDFDRFWGLMHDRKLVGTVEAPKASLVSDTVGSAADAVRAVLAGGRAG